MRFFVPSLLVLVVCRPLVARACDPAGPVFLEIDPALREVDTQAPVLGPLSVVGIHRGQRDDGNGCGGDCGPNGSILLANAATDDMTTPFEIGYQFKVVSGALPRALVL